MSTVEKPKAGLEDTVACSSAICYLDGDKGVLAYCGYDIHDLARHATFEEVCYLLWHRRLPTRAELGDLQSQLIAARPLPDGVLRLMRALPSGNLMDALRTLTSALGHYDADASDNSPQANYRKAVRLTAQISSLVATMGRMAKGQGPIDPDPVLGHAANFLYMLTGERPSGLATHAFDVALTLHADHELNASTFAARVAAATLTDIHSTIVGAIGALKGPLHGGANADVMRLLLRSARTPGRRKPGGGAGEAGAQGKSRASATASTTPRIRARPTCARCRAISASAPASRSGSRCRSASRRWSRPRRS
jgi:citrate synthase